jgi:hypothetical protein
MNIQELRQSLKMKWLSYYEENRPWLVKMRIWASYNGLRRPSSGFIVATLSVLEPEFPQIIAFLIELNNNPDEIVAALGLNFNPDKELGLIKSQPNLAVTQLEHEFPEEEPVTSVALTIQDAPSAITKAEKPEKLVVMPRLSKSMAEVVPINQPTPAIATSAKINTSLAVNQLPSKPGGLPTLTITTQVPNKAKPLPSIGLALATTPPRNGKVIRSLEITTQVPGKPKTLISPTLVTEISQNGKYEHKKPPAPVNKVNPTPQTNASNLASWVDEFCQGTEWHQEEAISM